MKKRAISSDASGRRICVGAFGDAISGSMVGEDVQIVWTEQGGPEVAEPQNLRGYGSNLVQRTMKDQLRGSVTYDWSQDGTVVTMLISGKRLST